MTTTADSGDGSLRAALERANAEPDADRIRFAIPGAGETHVIRLASELPAVVRPVTIDGYTQAGARPNGSERATDAVILIEITESRRVERALRLQGDDAVVRGLAFSGFTRDAIVIGSEGVAGVPAGGDRVTGNVVQGNFIGPDASGTGLLSDPNPGVSPTGASDALGTLVGNAGVGVRVGGGARRNGIGGPRVEDRT